MISLCKSTIKDFHERLNPFRYRGGLFSPPPLTKTINALNFAKKKHVFRFYDKNKFYDKKNNIQYNLMNTC